jgi:SNF2 family DNA or RNA helicase
LGQQKNVIVKRLIMKNTIEEEYYNKNKYDINDPILIG